MKAFRVVHCTVGILLISTNPLVYMTTKDEEKDKVSEMWFRALQLSIYLMLWCQIILTSVFLLVSLRYKQYLYYLEYYKKLVL